MGNIKTILRSAGAIVAGYIVTSLLTMVTITVLALLAPESYVATNVGWVWLNVAYGCLFAAVGGFVTAWLAPHRPAQHALVLGGLMAAFAALMAVTAATAPPGSLYAEQPGWYYPVLAITVLPCVALGGWLRARQLARA